MRATIVFEQIWNAINERTESGERKYRYFVLEGSSRSSKTQSILQAFYCYAQETERARMSAWRDTAKDARDTVLFDMNKVYPDLENYNRVKFNITHSKFTFPTKTLIEICGTDDVNKVHGYQGEVLWLNEPYKISKATFDQLDMRCTDIVLIDWNPKQAHWIDDLKKNERTKVIHSTFKDNPFVPLEQKKKILSYQPVSLCQIVLQKLLAEKEANMYDCGLNELEFKESFIKELIRCKENEFKNSANAFNWQVYGLGLKAERPNRIFRFVEIPDSKYFELDVPEYFASDWGAVDPWAIIGGKYYDGALYFREINYLSENQIREKLTPTEQSQISGGEEGLVVWQFNKFGIDKKATIICDPNRPEKIAALRRIGYPYAQIANKPAGSVNFGIDTLNNMPVYFTSSSLNFKYEQENYSRKVDRYGVVLEEPEDINNHCFVGDTLVKTSLGDKKIIDIKENELVLTSNGFKRILMHWSNGNKFVSDYKLYLNSGLIELSCTKKHLIKTRSGWIPICELRKGMYVFTSNHKNEIINSIEISNSRNESVFDLTIEDNHEYFANGILVHNCMDDARYIAYHLRRLGIINKI